MPEKKRFKMPWEELPSSGEYIPWEGRYWSFNIQSGYFTECDDYQIRRLGAKAGEVTSVRAPRDWPLRDPLNFADVDACRAICELTDCSFAEALVQHKGTKSFPPDYLERLKGAAQVYYEFAEEREPVVVGETQAVRRPRGRPPKYKPANPLAHQMSTDGLGLDQADPLDVDR